MRNYKGISINTSKNTHETVFDLLTKNKDYTVADIPSGSGAFILRLKDAGYKNIIAIDIEDILEIEHDNFVVGDMTKSLALENDTCHAVVCIDGIEHIDEQFHFVREVNRITKMKGEFIISTPNISSLRSRWKWLFTGHHHKCNSPLDENNPTPLHHVSMTSFPEIRYLLHTSGFEIVKVSTNRIKAVSWLYTLILPLVYVSTWWVYKKRATNQSLKEINREVRQKMFSKELLFGETMIVKAVKVKEFS